MSTTFGPTKFPRIAGAMLIGCLAAACHSGDSDPTGRSTPSTTTLQVETTGTIAGVETPISLTGPDGPIGSRTSGGAFEGLTAGIYQVHALPATRDGHRWDPFPADQTITIDPANGPAQLNVEYRLATGVLALDVSGLPSGINADMVLSGPTGVLGHIPASTTIRGLEPGRYRITLGPRLAGTARYDPVPIADSVTLSASLTPAHMTARFVRRVGFIALEVAGLPAGASAAIRVLGVSGYQSTATAPTLLGPLDPGSYTVIGDRVDFAGTEYTVANQPPAVQIDSGSVPVRVAYAPVTGSLDLQVTGLPAGTEADITVDGPAGFHATATGSTRWTGLTAGVYRVTAGTITVGSASFAATPGVQDHVVQVGPDATPAVVDYAMAVGALTLGIDGLPAGVDAVVSVSGPGGYQSNVVRAGTLTRLAPGGYQVTAGPVSHGGGTWQPTPASQAVVVAGGSTAAASITYQPATGALSIAVSGLPAGVAADVTVTGPGGFTASPGGTAMLTGLVPGSYQIAASTVQQAGTTWVATPTSATAVVTAGATASQAIAYAISGGGGSSLNLRIEAMYLTQATQRLDGSVPLVAGRTAVLRVFALANEANSATPAIRVRLYHGAALRQTYTLTAPTGSVPLAVDESALTRSWNLTLAPADVVPGMKLLADVDPAGSVPESDETDNQFPASGTPALIDVRSPGAFEVRFVPVQQQVNGLTGNVSTATTGQFLADPLRLLPIAGATSSVRAPYVTTAPVLQSGNGNNAWGTILSELLALRAADGESGYYYGVVQTTYGSGVAGIGYVGGSARTALGWDRLPSASGVMAHEVGHNLGRSHVGCGGPANPDPGYPHTGGGIGTWGLDVDAMALKNPASYKDLMSYCNPEWVSDYSWEGMLAYRLAGANRLIGEPSPSRGLLVWGRITAAGPVLEPAFIVTAPPTPVRSGPHRIELRDAAGQAILSRSFAAESHADLPTGAEEAFAFVIPLTAELETRVAAVVLRVGAQSVQIGSPAGPTEAAEPTARAAGTGSLLEWNPRDHPMVLVRDALTGTILSFARGGRVRVPVGTGRLRVSFTDGIRTTEEAPRLR
ncbi:MAG TPA: hypothetical protein VFN22_09335 [Gemmatimonadales bacterium]|nr:hypothetical protein [Gemmatimonadales bacterium]